MSSKELFGRSTNTEHPPFATDPAPVSGVFRTSDSPERLRGEKEALLAKCDVLRQFLQGVQGLEYQLRHNPFAHLESELAPREDIGTPAIISPDLLDANKNPLAEVEQRMLQEYPGELQALYVMVRTDVFQHPLLGTLGIQPSQEFLVLPPLKERSWKSLEAYAEQARRFILMQFPELLVHFRNLRTQVERLGYRLPAAHMADQEKMLSSSALLALQARTYEELVKTHEPQEESYLQMLEQDRQQLIREGMYSLAIAIGYLEELGAPIRREKEKAEAEAEAA